MALISWSDSLSVKIHSIDEQHKKLVNMLNGLHDSMQKGDSKEVLGKVLEGLALYTVKHFQYEEELFAKHGYAESDGHRAEHQDLLTQVTELQNKYNSNEDFMLGIEVLDFLKKWLTNHIQGSDKRYSTFLISKGVS